MTTHVLKPIDIGGVTIRNRVVRTAHGTRLAYHSFEDLFEFHAPRARGGVGLTILELMSVHPTSPNSLKAWSDSQLEDYGWMIDKLRPLGMKLFQQLWHGGQHTRTDDGSPSWSASDMPSPFTNAVPVVMTKPMIDEIVASFALAARKCEQRGVDGVEVHGCHGYLIQQFLSPNTNRRSDDYGGSFENRARFLLEILKAVRAEVSSGFPVGVRLGPDEATGGVSVDESRALVELLQNHGLVDFVNVSIGSYQNFDRILAGMHEPAGYELPRTVPVTKAASVPTIVTGRIRTLEEADQIIRQGDADLVGMTRAHIADPHIVQKTIDGRAEQVRPCIGCNQGCLAGLFGPEIRVGCTVNPTAGRERTISEERVMGAEHRKRVLVVGGGPAGMEAARLAAMRGHEVILAEARPRLGGAVNLAAATRSRTGIRDITAWQETELYRLGVEVRLSTYLEADEVLAEKADSVIVATGSTPRMDGIQAMNPGEKIKGVNQPHVLSSLDLLEGNRQVDGKSVLVADDTGHYEGIAVSEYLLDRGCRVTFVSRHVSFAPLLETSAVNEPMLRRLSSAGIDIHLRGRVISIGEYTAMIGPTYLPATSNRTRQIEADFVVLISPNRGNSEIFHALAGRHPDVRIVGDALSPRFLPTAVREGWMAGNAV
ncbi:FAD-dependent oxidoreductase [Arvimicrobium flavum]|uniref:oxidoreductase n=1 Tax=Arvimicrobium flavum TaxID=3393320 RepID=UPI00237A0960|nr:FAD-dependent oxidoreductase [Mesorhizobium shangrilense]